MRTWGVMGWCVLAAVVTTAACGSDDEGGGAGGAAGAADASAGAGGNEAGTGGSGGGSGGSAGVGGGGSGAGGTAGTTGGAAGASGAAGAGGGGGSQGIEIDFDLAAIPESATSFPSGVQSGDVSDARALLWTRYLGQSAPTLRVYRPTTPGKALLYFEAPAAPSGDGYVHMDASSLPAHTELFYVFLEGSAPAFSSRSTIGRFVSAPAPGAKPITRFGGTSCTDNDEAPFEALPVAAAKNLDFFVLAGDTTYNDSENTLPEYRARWLGQIGAPSYRSVLSSTSHYATWDDHEVDNDWNPETINKTRLANATQAFFEHLAIRRDITFPNRLWRKYSWGDAIEVFVLDCRGERKPSTIISQNPEYISPEQMAWLKQGLAASTATFKLIVNSVPITNFPGLFDFYSIDRWEGYGVQRAELLDFIVQQSIGGVLFVSGDFHLGASAQLEPAPHKWSALREVLMGPGEQGANPLWNTLPSPQFDFKTGQSNVTLFEADPNATPPTIKVTFSSGSGTTLFEKTYSF